MTHSKEEVRITGAEVVVVCSCGWNSTAHETETDATIEFETHVEASS